MRYLEPLVCIGNFFLSRLRLIGAEVSFCPDLSTIAEALQVFTNDGIKIGCLLHLLIECLT